MGYQSDLSSNGVSFNVRPYGDKVINAMQQGDVGTDTQKIQNALDMTVSGHKFIVIPPGNYVLNATLKLSSNMTLILYGAKLTLANGVNERIITNSDFVNGNQNVYIYGFGDSELNGNRAGQSLPSTPYKNMGVHFYKVNNFAISHVKIASTMKWSLVPEACTNGSIEDITFSLEGYQNQDGVHILGPSSNIQVNKIRGTFGDDACVVNARPSTGGVGIYQGYGVGGSITDIVFDNVHVTGASMDGLSHTSILRTSVGGTNMISGVILNNAFGENILSAARLGGDAMTTVDNHRDITISNVHVNSGFSDQFGQGVHVMRDVGNLKIHNLTTAKGGRMVLLDNYPFGWDSPSNIDGLIVTDCILKADVAPSGSDYVIKLKGASVKNAQLKNINIQGNTNGAIGYTGVWVKDTVLENVAINISVKTMIGVMKTEGTTTMKNVQLDYSSDDPTTPFDLGVSSGLTVNGAKSDKLYKPSGTILGTVENFKKIANGTIRFTNSGTNPTGVLLTSGGSAELRSGSTLAIEADGTFFAGSGITWFAREAPNTVAFSKVFQGYTAYLGGSAITLYHGDINGVGTSIGTFSTTINFGIAHKLRITHTTAGVITIYLDGVQMLQVTNTVESAGLFCVHTQAAAGTIELSRLEYAYI